MRCLTKTSLLKFGFNIDLLADTNAQLLKACGIGQSDYKGTMYWDRTSIVVDPKAPVRKVYEKVDPNGHEQTLLMSIMIRSIGARQ